MRCGDDSASPAPDRIHNGGPSTFITDGNEVPDTEGGDFKLHSSARVPKVLTFWRWCSSLVKMILRSRTPFAAFLVSTLHLRRSNVTSTSPLFPVPLPEVGIFDRMPLGMSLRARRRVHLKRVIHIVIMALNYWHGGLKAFPNLSLLARCPSRAHVAIYRRLKSIIAADGLGSGSFEMLVSGRKFPQLVARLGELSDQLTMLGAAGPYGHMYPGCPVPMNNETIPQLQPYRDLNASRLKISGSGSFDATDHLDDDLCMAYRVPDLLLSGLLPSPGQYPVVRDPTTEVEALARVWDRNGLCFLSDCDVPEYSLTKVFNNLKDQSCDRQIGDRRGRNYQEGRLQGPSRWLPAGSDLLDLHLKVPSETLRISCTDRKDFYHQFWISEEKVRSNAVGPSVEIDHLKGLKCYDEYFLRASSKMQKRKREIVGDQLHVGEGGFWETRHSPLLVGEVFVCFRALFQGDHVGVEVATSAHEHLLQAGGLLQEDERIVSCRPFSGSALCQGLVIDDYFAISREPRRRASEKALSFSCFQKSQEIYKKHGILGSPDKDVVCEEHSKVIGAEINSGDHAAKNGVATLGSPLSKRLCLSWLTLQCSSLSHTTDVLHLCLLGGWTSMLLFQRPLMSILAESRSLVDAGKIDSAHPRLVQLPRPVANEMVMLAVLAPLMVADLGAVFDDQVYSTDASDSKGAITSTVVPENIAMKLWRSGRSKGAYTRLKTAYELLIERLGMHEDVGVQNIVEEGGDMCHASPNRPLAFRYDFIEVYAGSSRVSQAMEALNFVVGPPIDIAFCDELDMTLIRVVSWLSFLISSGNLGSIMVEPVCTTFSRIRRPPLRSRSCPLGFDGGCEKTLTGNTLALRALYLLTVAHYYFVPGLAEQPWTSMMQYLPSWENLAKKEGAATVRTDSCAFGSPHQKSFRFLSVWMRTDKLQKRCDRTHSHITVEGRYTKASASYTYSLASAIAECFAAAIRARQDFIRKEEEGCVKGLENQLVNAIATDCQWRKVDSWTFQNKRHINILELKSVIRLAEQLVRRGRSRRVVNFVDSNVVRCSASKGRSSSKALTPFLRKYGALCLAGGLYFSLPYVPTRLNTSDDPTRDREVRGSFSVHSIDGLSAKDVEAMLAVPGLRRWASNWVRLIFGLRGFHGLSFHLPSRRFYGFQWSWPVSRTPDGLLRSSNMKFDSTCGFPGEGPYSSCRLLLWLACFSLPSSASLVAVSFFLGACFTSSHGMIGPQTRGDWHRRALRQNRPPLPQGRPVTAATTGNRERLLREFFNWCQRAGFEIQDWLNLPTRNLEKINEVLQLYGRRLYDAGRPYGVFVESINSIVSYKPVLRRQLQPAWDVAFAWVREERPTHHIAMPWQILLAMISVSLAWGWHEVAGILSLGWGALLRTSEMTSAVRRDLLLPSDTLRSNDFCLLGLSEPKTRFVAARHQTAKLDIGDLVRVCELAFRDKAPFQKLWPFSAHTFRLRFKDLLSALHLQTGIRQGVKSLDVGSLRPGGATWQLQTTEDPDFVRRRGRWVNSKVMEIYIQEIGSIQYLLRLSQHQRQRIFDLARLFPALLKEVELLKIAKIPSMAWYPLLSRDKP